MKAPVHDALKLRLPARRARVLIGMILTCFVVLSARAMYLQVWQNDFLQQEGASRFTRIIELPAHRGMITDRYGEPLAISTPVESVWASPADVHASVSQRRQLCKLLGLEEWELRRKLEDSGREFVYLKRHLPPEAAASVVQLGLPGISLKREYRRYYPDGEVAAQLIGITDVDDRGQEGIELAYHDWLSGKPGSRRVIKDRLGRVVEDAEPLRAPIEGRDLALSIDRITNGLTRPFFGWLSDQIGRENTMVIAFTLEGVAMTAWLLTRSHPAIFVVMSGVVLFAWGEIFSLFPSTLTDTFGTRHATENYGWLYISQGIGSIFGGPLAALMHQKAGSWVPVFGTAITLDILTAVLAIFMLKPMRARFLRAAAR